MSPRNARPQATLLVVDDRVENLIAVEAVLQPLGHKLVRALSGEEALRQVLLHDFAVILLDVQMPGMNGFETAQYIKSRDKSRHTPIIFLTAISKEEEYVFEGYSAGAVDYLFKPFNPDILRSKVSVFVDLYLKEQLLRSQSELLRQSEVRELELLHRTRLLESEARYAQIVDSATDAIITFGSDRRITVFNAAAERVFAVSTSEALGRAVDEFVSFPEMLDGYGDEVDPLRRTLPVPVRDVPSVTATRNGTPVSMRATEGADADAAANGGGLDLMSPPGAGTVGAASADTDAPGDTEGVTSATANVGDQVPEAEAQTPLAADGEAVDEGAPAAAENAAGMPGEVEVDDEKHEVEGGGSLPVEGNEGPGEVEGELPPGESAEDGAGDEAEEAESAVREIRGNVGFARGAPSGIADTAARAEIRRAAVRGRKDETPEDGESPRITRSGAWRSPRDGARIGRRNDPAAAQGAPTPGRPVETIGRRADGTTFPVEFTLSSLELQNERVDTLILRDISERRQAEELLREQKESLENTMEELRSLNEELNDRTVELEQAMGARSRFYASMSHELRTPINAILGYSALLLDNIYGPLNEKQIASIKRTNMAGTHLLELVNDILDLSKIEAGKLELQFEPVRFPTLVQDLFVTVAPYAEKHNVELTLETPDDEPWTSYTDPRKVRQIALNLLSNAIKFGSGKPVRVVCSKRDDGGFQLEVTDHGPGISAQDHERIFEEFVQLDQTATDPGTGLGLPISRSLAQLLGGTLTVTSTPGVGSTFTLVVPRQEKPALSRLAERALSPDDATPESPTLRSQANG